MSDLMRSIKATLRDLKRGDTVDKATADRLLAALKQSNRERTRPNPLPSEPPEGFAISEKIERR
jgi:hypothetical protein